MAQGNRAAASVDLILADAQQFQNGEYRDGERFVELDAIDLVERESRSLECFADRRHQTDAHFLGIDPADRQGANLGERLRP
jgi:hypothetical protein